MRRLSRVLPLLVLSTACQPAPDDPLFYVGQALREDGTPWADAEVELQRSNNGVQYLGVEPIFEPWVTVKSGEDGRFLHELRVFDTRRIDRDPRGDTSRMCRVRLPPSTEGGRTSLLFFMNFSDADLPPLRAWHSGLRQTLEGSRAVLSWEPAPPTQDTSVPRYRTVLRSGETVLWQELAGETGGSLPTDVGEDFPALTLSVEAYGWGSRQWFPLSGRGGFVNYELVHESPRVSLPAAPVRLPVSRGARCDLHPLVYSENATPAPGPRFEPCPLTDGRLDSLVAFIQDASDLTLVLSEPSVPRRALFRGLSTPELRRARMALLEGSADGETWHVLADFGERLPRELPGGEVDPRLATAELYLDLALTPPPVPVTRVRVRLFGHNDFPLGVRLPRELSLFE
jgi:hypothetical protein